MQEEEQTNITQQTTDSCAVLDSKMDKMTVKSYMFQQKEWIMSTDMFLLKKRLLLMSLFIRYSLCGVEYSVVLPTALLYLKSLDAGPFFTGVTIAAYPAAAMISLPIFGYLYDKTKRTKELLLLLNFFELVGNILYALPYSKWFPGFGRFIAGLGDGFFALSVGEITHIYAPYQRLGILSIMELGRMAGIIVGPTFNILIKGQRYFIDTWVLNDDTLPGVLMAFLWLLMELITAFCVFNLAKECTAFTKPKTEEEAAKEPLLEESNGNDTDCSEDEQGHQEKHLTASADRRETSSVDVDQEERDIASSCSDSSSSIASNGTRSSKASKQIQNSSTSTSKSAASSEQSYWEKLVEIFCVEFVIIALVDFVLWFSQTNMEILCPYITEFSYHWSPATTGLIYVFGGIEIVLAFGLLYVVATRLKVKETSFLAASLVFTQMGAGLLIYETIPTNIHVRYGIFAATATCVFASIPLNLVCSKNLLTKLFRPELQGMVQGISSAISRITMITGPILSGFIYEDRRTYGVILSIVCFCSIVAFFSCTGKLNKRVRTVKKCLKDYE